MYSINPFHDRMARGISEKGTSVKETVDQVQNLYDIGCLSFSEYIAAAKFIDPKEKYIEGNNNGIHN